VRYLPQTRILISFERMNRIVEHRPRESHGCDRAGGHPPGARRGTLTPRSRLPGVPGRVLGQPGGNVATNAGGMRAVKYGVTRSQVLALVAVLGTEVIRTGGKFMKAPAATTSHSS